MDYNGFDQSTMNDGVKGDVIIIERITMQLPVHFNLHSNNREIIIIRIAHSA